MKKKHSNQTYFYSQKSTIKKQLLYSILMFLYLGCYSLAYSQTSSSISKDNIYVAAHRGGYENEYKDKAPENSIANIQNAINYGYEIYETDVNRTLDGVFVIMHDQTIDRTTNGTGRVDKLTSEELKKYRLTYYRSHRGEISEEPIPLFEEFISKGGGKIIFKIDFKSKPKYLIEFIEIIQSLKLKDRVILRLPYTKEIINEIKKINLDESPQIFFRIKTLAQFRELKNTFNPRMISLITKNYFTKEHLQIIKEASNENILIEAHTFYDRKNNRDELLWEEQIKLPITIYHTNKPIRFKKFLEEKQK